MKMMNTETCIETIEVVSNSIGKVEATYVRSRDLKFTVRVCIKPWAEEQRHFISDNQPIEFADRHSVVPIVQCLDMLKNRLQDIAGSEVQSELIDYAMNALHSRKAKDYIEGQIPRRVVNARIHHALKGMYRPFENNKNFRRKYANLTYRISRTEVIDLMDEGKSDYEQIALMFIKTPTGFNIALDYRFLRPEGKGVDNGRVLLSKHQPETPAALYGLTVKGLKELEKQLRIKEGTMEILAINAERQFADDERDLSEVLYRHHTFNI